MARQHRHYSERTKPIIKLFEKLAYRHSTWEVFSDFLLMAACSISNSVDWIHREEREKQYMEVIKKYTKEEINVFPEIFAELVAVMEQCAQENDMQDILGRVFHELELHNKYKGQFFTPQNVSDMMAKMSIGEKDLCIERRGFVTVGEPTCGSGVMVISFAKAMREAGHNYSAHMVAAKHGYGIVSPLLAPWTVTNTTNSTGHSANEPMDTVRTGGGGGQMFISPTLIQYHGEKSSNDVRGQSANGPIMTVDGANRYGMVSAFLSKYYDGGHKGCGNGAQEPLNTITSVDHNALIAANIIKLKGTNIGHKADMPLQTLTASGNHFGEVRAFLVKYYGAGTGQEAAEPLHTVTGKDTFGLVTIQGTQYAIVDIGLRMLTPRELFLANGFPPDYIIDKDDTGKAYPKNKQVARCGNAVPPQFSEALVRANLPELCGKRIFTMAELESRIAI